MTAPELVAGAVIWLLVLGFIVLLWHWQTPRRPS